MPNRGQLVIIGMATAAVAAAAGAWWYQYQQGQRILGLWGAPTAYRIRLAPECDLLWLEPQAAAGDGAIRIQDSNWRIRAQRAVGNAPGFVHARQALIQDASYDWATPPVLTGPWQFALRFREGPHETLLAFDLEHATVLEPGMPGRTANIGPICAGLQRFFEEQGRGVERDAAKKQTGAD